MELFSFGPWLWLTRLTFLPQALNARHALVLGDGDGRFTARLLRANPQVQIDAVDASPAMLAALGRRAGPHAARLTTHLADIRSWQPCRASSKPFDLVVTHFFLDCLDTAEVQSLAARLRAIVTPGALWIISEFAIPPGWFGRSIGYPVVTGLYFAFAWLTGLAVRRLPDHASALRAVGFTLLKRRARLHGLLVAELWSTENAPTAFPESS